MERNRQNYDPLLTLTTCPPDRELLVRLPATRGYCCRATSGDDDPVPAV